MNKKYKKKNTTTIDLVRRRFAENIDTKVLESSSARFFKEERAKVYGIRMGDISKIAKEY